MSEVTLGSNFNELTPEQKEEYAALVRAANTLENPEGFEFFAFVVDGKVSVLFTPAKETMQNYIDALSSDPVIVKLSDAQKNAVFVGWDYDEQTGEFSEPE